MEVSKNFLNLVTASLSESISQTDMVHLARELIPNYDIRKKLEMSKYLDIPRRETAQQIVNDMYSYNMLVPFINVLLSIQFKGYMGRQYNVSKLNQLLEAMYKMGFNLDRESGMLYEDPTYRVSPNWGVLIEGRDYSFSYLWIDVVGFSRIVKQHKKSTVKQFMSDFMDITRYRVEKRNGRIWHVEGDGILAAFHFEGHMNKSVFCGIDILHRFFDYNRFESKLNSPIALKLSVHTGLCEFSESHEDIKMCDQVQQTIQNNEYAEPDSVVISNSVGISFNNLLSEVTTPIGKRMVADHYLYQLKWGKE